MLLLVPCANNVPFKWHYVIVRLLHCRCECVDHLRRLLHPVCLGKPRWQKTRCMSSIGWWRTLLLFMQSLAMREPKCCGRESSVVARATKSVVSGMMMSPATMRRKQTSDEDDARDWLCNAWNK